MVGSMTVRINYSYALFPSAALRECVSRSNFHVRFYCGKARELPAGNQTLSLLPLRS